ncbi:MAG TPA: Ig-like domain-containing protein [Kofleriaceae bacterium]|nr:Ig-like domain-containing protein [Kofleriaceae bacterium]
MCAFVSAAAGCGGDADGGGGSDPDGGAGDGGSAADAAPGLRAPVAQDLAIDVEVGGGADGALVASDADGDPLTWSIVEPPSAGTLAAFDPATGAFRYQTDSLVSGVDSFTAEVTDGSTAPARATVTVSIVPFVFTGDWALGAVGGCAGGSFFIAHAPHHLDIGQRTIVCGSTTYRFDAIYARVDGSDILWNGADVGDLGDTSIDISRSMVVSGCGTVSHRLQLVKTAGGYTYHEAASVPCGPDPDMSAAPTYTPVALVEPTPQAHSLGSAAAGATASGAVTLMNIGKLTAGALGASLTPAETPFGFAGGAYPGAGGTCSATLAPRDRCTMTMTASSATAGNPQASLLVSYQDGTGDPRGAYGSLLAYVLPPLAAPTAVSVQNGVQCALDGGAVACWGSSDGGRTSVPPLTDPIAVDVGNAHACAVDDSGVVCWGTGSSAPPAMTSPTAVSAGAAHSCALAADGVHCWGDDSRGQSTVPPLENPIAVSAGGYHSCALDDTGVHCWGWNNIGQTSVPPLSNPTAVTAGAWHTCALDDAGVHCWGRNYDGESTVPPLDAPALVSAGQYRTCAADAAGVHCWGADHGGVGFEPALSGVTALSADSAPACAIAGGALRCW